MIVRAALDLAVHRELVDHNVAHATNARPKRPPASPPLLDRRRARHVPGRGPGTAALPGPAPHRPHRDAPRRSRRSQVVRPRPAPAPVDPAHPSMRRRPARRVRCEDPHQPPMRRPRRRDRRRPRPLAAPTSRATDCPTTSTTGCSATPPAGSSTHNRSASSSTASRATRAPPDQVPRPAPHPRLAARRRRRAHQGRQRTPRPRPPRLHHAHLPAPAPRHERRGRRPFAAMIAAATPVDVYRLTHRETAGQHGLAGAGRRRR